MRKPIIAGNWKMFKTIPEALELVIGLKRELYQIEDKEIVVCPPFTALSEVSEVITSSNIKLGAQDLFWLESGPYTGEISPLMLKDTGCQYVIIGHSERRIYFSETNETVNKKLKAALRHNLIPIVCVGETLKERQAQQTFKVVQDQIDNSLASIGKEEALKIVMAYEPVWAIGTGQTATPQQAQEVQEFIRKLLIKKFGEETAEEIRILYGGSIKPDNIRELSQQKDIDGGLVGGASLEINSFVSIVKNCLIK
ncbi:MAG: triose-phosphate isomerase [Candidatus Omnitrophota bacterium]|nr:triose-phosphate isomerase [Candidatus Omnitrophota bacterium]